MRVSCSLVVVHQIYTSNFRQGFFSLNSSGTCLPHSKEGVSQSCGGKKKLQSLKVLFPSVRRLDRCDAGAHSGVVLYWLWRPQCSLIPKVTPYWAILTCARAYSAGRTKRKQGEEVWAFLHTTSGTKSPITELMGGGGGWGARWPPRPPFPIPSSPRLTIPLCI